MASEFHNLLTVWSTIFISSLYCYTTIKFIPKGAFRFFIFFPILCIFLYLPSKLNTIILSNPTTFFMWQTAFKILLLIFDNGPLSNPSLTFLNFFTIYSLPITLQGSNKPKHPNPDRNKIGFKHHFKNASLLLCLIYFGICYRHKIPYHVELLLVCIYVYVGLETLLVSAAILAQYSLGAKFQVDPPLDDPYLATSLQDFWGRRWNRVASNSLRSTVFRPTFKYTCNLLGRQWSEFVGLIFTFMVSDVMHEILFYYLGRVKFGWGPMKFFLLHGVLVALEGRLKRNIHFKRRIPQMISGPLIFGFVISTFMWLVLPELMAINVNDKVLQEYAAVGRFFKELARA